MTQDPSARRQPWQLQHAVALGVALGTALLTIWLGVESVRLISHGEQIARDRLAAMEADLAQREAALRSAYSKDIEALNSKAEAARKAYEQLQKKLLDDERALRAKERRLLREQARLDQLKRRAREQGLRFNSSGDVVVSDGPESLWEQAQEWVWGSWEEAQALAAEVKALRAGIEASEHTLKEAYSALDELRLSGYKAMAEVDALTKDRDRQEEIFNKAISDLRSRSEPGLNSARVIAERWGGVLFQDASALLTFILHVTTAFSSLLMAATSATRFFQLRGHIGPVRIR